MAKRTVKQWLEENNHKCYFIFSSKVSGCWLAQIRHPALRGRVERWVVCVPPDVKVTEEDLAIYHERNETART